MKIKIINGPNLNLLGTREPEKYGSVTFEAYYKQLQEQFKDIELSYEQSNVEGELVTLIQQAASVYDGVILNAAAYTHTSIAIGDAVAAIETPVVEVHISNVLSREEYRHISYISPHVAGVIYGFGLEGYALALNHFKN